MFDILFKKTDRFKVVGKQEVFDLKALSVVIRTKTDTYCFLIPQELRPYTCDYSLHTGQYVCRQTEETAGHTIRSLIRYQTRYAQWCGLHPDDDFERYCPGNPFAMFQMDDGTTVTIPSSDILEIKQTLYTHASVTKSVDALELI
jgi:hypothetical protein